LADEQTQKPDTVIIKKYANRRLYNTETSSYVTLEHLAQMVKDGRDFIVKDAKSGEDITRAVLAQIIFDEESKGGQTLLPARFLRQLISFYGHGLESVVPTYLENSLEMFSRNQERFYDYVEQQMNAAQAFKGSALGPFEEIARQNMAAFERATKMFSGLAGAEEGGEETASSKPEPGGNPAKDGFEEMQRQLKAMQDQLDKLSGKPSGKK
jgi:polyhydroxyalkanoate synthesis repressor PhaR